MAQRTGEPRVLRSRSSRVVPPSSSQTEDTSAPATDARSDKQDFLDSVLSSMQEQQRLMTFLIERQQQQLTAQTHPAVPSPSAQLAQLSPLARRVELPILADPQTLDLSAFVNWKSRWQDYLRLTRIETELTDAPLQQAFLRFNSLQTWFYMSAYVKKSSPGSTQLPTSRHLLISAHMTTMTHIHTYTH